MNILAARYDNLTLGERVNSIAAARQAGWEAAAADRGAAGGIETTVCPPRAYYACVVEPAWHAELIDDATLIAWRDGNEADGDPRVDAFRAAWEQDMADALADAEE